LIKRIFSKKSGFTLVEIVVAFAVFALMAAAIMQILTFVSPERSANVRFMESLEQQEEYLAANGKKEFEKQDGEVVLNIKGNDNPSKIAYNMKAANGDAEGVGGGLVYFVSKDSQGGESPSTGGGSSNKGGEQGQLGTVDARITGTPKFDTIAFDKVEKATDYEGPGVCYYFQMHANAPFMTNDEAKYAMFKLNFFSTDTVSETEERDDAGSKKTYTRETPMEAYIIDAGYINSDTLSWSYAKSVVLEKNYSSGSDKSPYCITKTGDNTLRISSPYVNDGGTQLFNNRKFSFYVVFDKDPNLTRTSFGHNAQSNGVYRACPIYKETYTSDGNCKYEESGKTSNYIYGAYMYKRNYK